MQERMNKAKEFVDISIQWKENICIYGAGEFGTGWVYELICDFAGLKVDFYVDRNKVGQKANNIEIKDIDYLENKKETTLCFVALAENTADGVCKKLKEKGIKYIFVLSKQEFIYDLVKYIYEKCDSTMFYRYRKLMDDKQYITRIFKKRLGYDLNIENPKTFNEKVQWLKLNDRRRILPLVTDKYLVRQYIKEKFGEQYLIPLLFVTKDYKELTYKNIPDEKCIIKTNCGSHDYYIVRDKKEIDEKILQNKYKDLLSFNYYYYGREWNYKDIEPCIIIERLLEDKNGKIPNDYKLTFFNGELQFVYCSIDREGLNYRKIYNPKWDVLNFSIGHPLEDYEKFPNIEQPSSFHEMVRIGKEIAKDFSNVRVDFYDIDGKLYCGEITLFHGSGFDKFYPEEYDLYWGRKLELKEINNELYK